MNERELISRLSAMPDRGLAVRVDVDNVIAAVRQQRKRRRAVAGVVLATAGLVAGLIVATNQPDRGAEPAAQGNWTVNTPDIKDAVLAGIAPISQTDVWAVGQVRAAGLPGLATHWDGTRWTRYVLPKGYSLFDVTAVGSDDVWAVGISIDEASRLSKPVATHWDGNVWREVPVPATGGFAELRAVAAVSANDVWAVGDGIVHWDGSSWQEVTIPAILGVTGMSLQDISARTADDIWVVGYSEGMPEKQPLSLHWDGRQWAAIPVATGAGVLSSVAALAPNDAWAAASDQILHWDGSAWRNVPIPIEGTMALAPDGAGGILAAGQRPCKRPRCVVDLSDLPHLVFARWSGKDWAVIEPPADTPGAMHRLRAAPGAVWAVGQAGDGADGVAPIVAFTSFR